MAPGLRDSLISATQEHSAEAAAIVERRAAIEQQQTWLAEREARLKAEAAWLEGALVCERMSMT
eukprot:133085-Prymnesium_polylepis.1